MSKLIQLKKRLEKIEEELAPKHREPIEVLMWVGKEGGLYGHSRINIYTGETTPCSDEEEIEIMRESWEAKGHKCWGRDGEEPVSFEEYLKHFEYLKQDKEAGTRKGEKDGT